MAKVFDDAPGLFEASRRVEKSVDVLRSAIDQLKPPREGERWAELAVRMKGAAILAATAALEISTVAGWNESASAMAEAGLLDGSDDP
jgi:hypothetical protein